MSPMFVRETANPNFWIAFMFKSAQGIRKNIYLFTDYIVINIGLYYCSRNTLGNWKIYPKIG
jgi:hypothetical protein